MAWTQTDLETIETAIAEGTRIVRLDNRSIEYHSISQMLKARDAIKKFLDDLAKEASGAKPRPRVFRIKQSKGL